MKTIWKYELRPDGATVGVPEGAKILTVQAQKELPCIWCLVDTDARQENRTFRVYGTGHPMPVCPGDYCGTFQLMGGSLVFHVFEVRDDDDSSPT